MTTTPFQTPTTEAEAQAQWEANRRDFIGGSEAFELLNQSQYGKGCSRALAYRKLGAIPDYPDPAREDDALYRRGKLLEPIAGELYMEATGRALRRPPRDMFDFPIPRLHKDFAWAGVNTDRIIYAGVNAPDSTGDLEIKTRDHGPWLRVHRDGPFPGDELQLQWSLWVTGHDWGALATLGVWGGLPLTHFDRKADKAMAHIFAQEGTRFADTVFGKRQLPDPPFAASDTRCKTCPYRLDCRGEEIDKDEVAALRQVKASTKNLVQIDDPELAVQLGEMDLLKQEARAIELALDVAKDNLEFRLDGIQAALVKGYGRVTRVVVASKLITYERDAYSYWRRTPNK